MSTHELNLVRFIVLAGGKEGGKSTAGYIHFARRQSIMKKYYVRKTDRAALI